MSSPKGIILLSGGMDSCVSLAEAIHLGYEPWLLHVNYGQRTQNRELTSFRAIASHYQIPANRQLVSDISHLLKIGGSSLTDSHLPVSEADLSYQGIPTSYVPFRNANILAIAVSWAEVIGASAIFIGAVEEDSSGYPDCRASFFNAYEAMIKEGTRPETSIRILTPVIRLSKSEIVKRGMELHAPLHLTWSCYQSEEQACGHCDSCALRLRGFQLAGFEDPLPYSDRPVYNIPRN